MSARDILAASAYAAGWRAIRALPAPAARGIFRLGADYAWRRNAGSVQRLRRNLTQVLGHNLDVPPDPEHLEDAVRAGMRSYARYWMEAFRLPSLSTRAVLDGMVLENSELLFDAVAAGRGVIGALPHSANWDHAGAWARAQDLPLTTVAERLKPDSLYRKFVAYREGLGMEILPTSGGAQPPLDILTSRLEQGRVVVLLADRDLSSRGVEVNFFGGRTRMPAGPALLALRTGAPLLVVSLWYDDKILRARIHPAIDVPSQGNTREKLAAMTQAMADEFAHGIAAHPQDWHMLQRLWPERERATAAGVSPPGSPT